MKVFDENFRSNKLRYILQCILATLSISVILLLFDTMTNAIIIAALGSSAFVTFTMPKAQVSRPRFMIGGYIVGIVVGLVCYYLSTMPLLTNISIIQETSRVVFGALAVGLAIFVMVITDTEHPPAAGLALALILNEWNYMAIVVTMVGIISLSVIKTMLRSILENLL
ncbi:MAG: HPP family protein [Candidatus Scalinduaceae bacterium]